MREEGREGGMEEGEEKEKKNENKEEEKKGNIGFFWMCLVKTTFSRWKERRDGLHHNFGDEEVIFPPNSKNGCVIVCTALWKKGREWLMLDPCSVR